VSTAAGESVRSRWPAPLVVGLVLLGTVAGFFLAAWTSLRVQSAVRVLIESEAQWSLGQARAVGHLTNHALEGDPAALNRYHEALAYPRAVRPALMVALERPGDAEALAEVLAANPLTSGNIPVLRLFFRLFGDDPTTLGALNHWLRADRALVELEAAAADLVQQVEDQGPASPQVLELLDRIQTTDRELQAVGDQFAPAIAVWVDRVERWTRFGVTGVALGLLAGGGLILGLVNRRIVRADETIRESRERFRQITETIDQVFWLTDVDKTRVFYVSPAYEEVWGRPLSELYANPRQWLEAIVPDDRDQVREAVPRQARGEYEVEYRIVRPDGRIRWIRDRGFPVADEDGQVRRVAGLAEDITRQREVERELVKGRAYRAVGSLAGGVAHEFNNLLTALKQHAHLALMEAGDEAELREDLESILELSQKGENLTRKLLSFSGRQLLQPQPLDVGQVVLSHRDAVKRSLPWNVSLTVEVAPDLPTAYADAKHFLDAAQTLIGNAAEALEGGGHLLIQVDRVQPEASIPVHGGTLEPGEYIRIRLTDSGNGLREGEAARFFDPLDVEGADPDRTLPVSLGLPAIYGLVTQTGGGICVETPPDGGARFVIFLPTWRHATGREPDAGP